MMDSDSCGRDRNRHRLVDFIFKIGYYHLHERVWHKTRWGVIRQAELLEKGNGIQ